MLTVIGFGANLGDRLGTMRAALQALSRFVRIEQTSRVFESAPVGPPQPHFLNAAARVTPRDVIGAADCALPPVPTTPEALLDVLLAIEADLGRVRRERWGPRTVDLDILWIADTIVATPRLSVPHPHLRERAFALVPLLDLVPDARDPHTRQRYVAPPGDLVATGDIL